MSDTGHPPAAEAPRGDHVAMARLARALYEEGLGPREVLRRCYGVDLPDELFVIAEAHEDPADLGLQVAFTDQPWNLAVPLDRGGPIEEPHVMSAERDLLARDRDLLPLAWLIGSEARHGGSIVCYRLSELAADRTTVFAIGDRVEPDDEVRRAGDSLLSVLHEFHVDRHRLLRDQYFHESNIGAGSVDRGEVDAAAAAVVTVEELQRRLAAG